MTFQLILLFCSLLPALILSFIKPAFFRQLFLDIRLIRILHYFILFLFGLVLYLNTFSKISATEPIVWMKVALYFIVLVYAAVFAIVSNNIEDIEIDRITNTNRPLIQNTVDPKLYMLVARLSLFVSLAVSILIGIGFFLAILGISLIYYLYSCKPFKLKRFVILAKFLIGLNSLISALCGYFLAAGSIKNFPLFWILFILIPVSLMANFVDLKDTEGDKKAGIKTLPVIFGELKTKYFIALFIFVAYISVIFYFKSFWISLVVSITCTQHIYLLFRKPYKEKPLFMLHNCLFIGLILLLLMREYL
jgi:4-hydroxybenzoate polyprenyltransferase